jgi:hypothetical protein
MAQMRLLMAEEIKRIKAEKQRVKEEEEENKMVRRQREVEEKTQVILRRRSSKLSSKTNEVDSLQMVLHPV